MPRSMSSAMLAVFAAGLVRPAVFVEAHFASGPTYVWTGLGSIAWNGHTWLGVGSLLDIDLGGDGSTVQARGIVLTLSGLDPSFLAAAIQEVQIGLPVVIYLGLFNDAGNIIADPIITWAGQMDQPHVEIGGSAVTISISCENRLLEMNISSDARFTMADQTAFAPGDMGFQFVSGVSEINIYWGKSPSTAANV